MLLKSLIILLFLASTPLLATPVTTEAERTAAVSDVQLMALPFDIQLTPILPPPPPGSSALNFLEGQSDYVRQLTIPTGFGEGEFTLVLTVNLDETYPVGFTSNDRLIYWSQDDRQPGSVQGWWYDGNFLLDGHNNATTEGSFDLQIVGGIMTIKQEVTR